MMLCEYLQHVAAPSLLPVGWGGIPKGENSWIENKGSVTGKAKAALKQSKERNSFLLPMGRKGSRHSQKSRALSHVTVGRQNALTLKVPLLQLHTLSVMPWSAVSLGSPGTAVPLCAPQPRGGEQKRP